jgi:hypothetical protein
MISLGFGLVFFSCLFVVALASKGPSKATNVSEAKDELPSQIKALLPTTKATYLHGVPWSTSMRSLIRNEMSHLDLITLNGPKETLGTWHMSTEADFLTTEPNTYPIKTVVVIPEKSDIVFMIDQDLRPLQINKSGNAWTLNGKTIKNVTGNYAHSFVIVNETDHTLFFGRQAKEPQSYIRIDPGQYVLLWPSTTYYPNAGPVAPTEWNAKILPDVYKQKELSASVAESIMYSVLRVSNP